MTAEDTDPPAPMASSPQQKSTGLDDSAAAVLQQDDHVAGEGHPTPHRVHDVGCGPAQPSREHYAWPRFEFSSACTKGTKLGCGSCGTVYEATVTTPDGTTLSGALKVAHNTAAAVHTLSRELEAAHRLAGVPGLPAVYAWAPTSDGSGARAVLFERLPGTLRGLIAQRLKEHAVECHGLRPFHASMLFQPSEYWPFTSRLVALLEAAHARGVLHANVCPDKILLDAGNNPRLVGWGLFISAPDFVHTAWAVSSPRGAPGYCLPELQPPGPTAAARERHVPVHHSIDTQPLALTVVEMLLAEGPEVTRQKRTQTVVFKGYLPEDDRVLAVIVSNCLHADRDSRMTAHRWGSKCPHRHVTALDETCADTGAGPRDGSTSPQPKSDEPTIERGKGVPGSSAASAQLDTIDLEESKDHGMSKTSQPGDRSSGSGSCVSDTDGQEGGKCSPCEASSGSLADTAPAGPRSTSDSGVTRLTSVASSSGLVDLPCPPALCSTTCGISAPCPAAASSHEPTLSGNRQDSGTTASFNAVGTGVAARSEGVSRCGGEAEPFAGSAPGGPTWVQDNPGFAREDCDTPLVECSGGLSALLPCPHGVDAAADSGVSTTLNSLFAESGGLHAVGHPAAGALLGDGATLCGDSRAEAARDVDGVAQGVVEGVYGHEPASEDGVACLKCGKGSGVSLAQHEVAVIAGAEEGGQVAAQVKQRWGFGRLRKLFRLRFGCLMASQCHD